MIAVNIAAATVCALIACALRLAQPERPAFKLVHWRHRRRMSTKDVIDPMREFLSWFWVIGLVTAAIAAIAIPALAAGLTARDRARTRAEGMRL